MSVQVNLYYVESVLSVMVQNSKEMTAWEAYMMLHDAGANRITVRHNSHYPSAYVHTFSSCSENIIWLNAEKSRVRV